MVQILLRMSSLLLEKGKFGRRKKVPPTLCFDCRRFEDEILIFWAPLEKCGEVCQVRSACVQRQAEWAVFQEPFGFAEPVRSASPGA